MEDQNQPNAPNFSSEQQPPIVAVPLVPENAQKTPEKAVRFSKKLIVVIVAVAFIVVLAIGAIILNLQANAAAKQYAKDIDVHLIAVFSESNTRRRTETIKDAAILKPVFLGSVLSSTYKQVSTETKSKYLAIIVDGAEYTKLKAEYGDSIKETVKDIQNVLKAANEKINISDDVDPKTMETTLLAMLEKANRLGQIADKVEGIESLNQYSDRTALIESLRNWSAAQNGVVQEYVDWTGGLTTWGSKLLNELVNDPNKSSHDTFDATTYQTRINWLVDRKSVV